MRKFAALLYIKNVNGYPVSALERRPNFEDLTPVFPNSRLHMETQGKSSTAMRVLDLLAPIGKGQRGMIVSPPKAGKTTLLKQVAQAVTTNHPDMHMIILLIDERPEEVTDIKESVVGKNVEVIYSTFDELPDRHKRVSEMVIERAKRLVEHGRDVIILWTALPAWPAPTTWLSRRADVLFRVVLIRRHSTCRSAFSARPAICVRAAA